MGNLVTDAMLAKYPDVEAAITNSGGLRGRLARRRRQRRVKQPGEITWGEMFAVLPFGNRTIIFTLTGDQLTTAMLNGFSPCATRRSLRAGSRRFAGCGSRIPATDRCR